LILKKRLKNFLKWKELERQASSAEKRELIDVLCKREPFSMPSINILGKKKKKKPSGQCKDS
jgi:hypothetical protein